MTPLVSIVTPSFNQAPFVRAAVESVLGQDYAEIEYWVIDGGSTDGTQDILHSYEGNPRFHWLSEPDRGQADAVAKGWARESGPILGWLNSDDVLKPGAVRKAVEALARFPEAAFVYSHIENIDPSGKVEKIYRVRQAGSADQILFNCQIPQQTVFLRRDCYDRSGGMNIDLHYMMDQELWLRILLDSPGKFVNDVWAQQRFHAEAKTQAKWQETYREYHAVVQTYAGHAGIPAAVRREALRRAALYMFIVETSRKDYPQAIDHLQVALAGAEYPFGGPGAAVQHVSYLLRHWNDLGQIRDLLSGLLAERFAKPNQDARGFVNLLIAYNDYMDGRFSRASRDFKQLLIDDPGLRKDLYIRSLPLRCSVGQYAIRARRYLRDRKNYLELDQDS